MRGYLGNTDYDWYTFLQEWVTEHPDLEEVNFWQPSGNRGFRAIPRGAPFFFKLKKPHYAIAGFGFLSYTTIQRAWSAWDLFQEANGAPDFGTMIRRIEKYRDVSESDPTGSYMIGCLMIMNPVFFEKADWVPAPRGWPGNTVQGKTYDLTEGEGRRIWEACRARARALTDPASLIIGGDRRYGDPTPIRPRLGQNSFRFAVLDAYGGACAVSQEHSLPALEACHIKPYQEGGEHSLANGIALRSDIHRLFDTGYVTITPGHRFLVSGRLKDDFSNGRSYREFHGQQVHLPRHRNAAPDPRLLEWHGDAKFRG